MIFFIVWGMTKKKCIFTAEETMQSYVGVGNTCLSDKSGFCSPWPFLIERVIRTLNFDNVTTNVYGACTSSVGSKKQYQNLSNTAKQSEWTHSLRCAVGK